MNFLELLNRIKEIDSPSTTEQSVADEGCGMPPPALPAVPSEPETPPPTMSINMNAQGLDNIEELMALIKAVNSEKSEPSVMALPPLKMLPDFDADNDSKIGREKDHMEPDGDEMPIKGLDRDGDGDHDMKDHDLEKEEFANEPDEDIKDIDYMVNKLSGGLGKRQGTYPKVAGADNPMQRMESSDLRSQIRAELMQRLQEAKNKVN